MHIVNNDETAKEKNAVNSQFE